MSAMRELWSDPGFLAAIHKGQASGAVALASEDELPTPVWETSTISAAPASPKAPLAAPAPVHAAPQKGAAPGGIQAPAPKKSPTLTIVTYSGATQLLVNTPERFKVTLTLPNGSTKDVTDDVTWDPPDLSINDRGYTDVKVAPGDVTITATYPKKGATVASGSIKVSVVARKLQKIIITPRNPMVERGQFTPLRARGYFSDNTDDDITFIVTWESRNHKGSKIVATVNRVGNCEGTAPGTADIWAYDNDAAVVDTTPVTVYAPGKAPRLVKLHVTPVDPTVSDFTPLQFTAMGDFADNVSRDVTSRVRWVAEKPDTLAIDENTGLATPGLVGDTARITAWATPDLVTDPDRIPAGTKLVDDHSEVTVQVPMLESIEIAPRDPFLPKGTSVDVTVTGTFSNGPPHFVTDRVTWSNSNSAVATIVMHSILGDNEGTTKLGATVPRFSDVGDFITVTVLPPVVSFIDIAPGSATLQVNGKQTFVATAVSSDGGREVLTGRNVRWSSDDEKTVFIDRGSGEATAKGSGTATITATHRASRRSGTVTVTVEPPKVTAVQVTPDKQSIKVNGTVQLTATAKFSDNHTEDQTGSAYWASDREDIATVVNGKVTGNAVGKASISATSDGETGSVDVEVTP